MTIDPSAGLYERRIVVKDAERSTSFSEGFGSLDFGGCVVDFRGCAVDLED
jgi:hypothetical protein